MALGRRDVLALSRQIREQDGPADASLQQVLENHGVEAAGLFALAAIAAGKPLEARLIARLLPALKDQADMFPVLVWHGAGDRLAMLLDLTESDSMYYERSTLCLFLAMELLGDTQPPRLLTILRHYARLMDPDAMLGHLIGRVRDPAVRQIGAAHLRRAAVCTAWIRKEVLRLRRRLKAPPLDFLPEEPVRRIRGFTACRPTERVGRNDPCPCGSGQKYKKCCQPRDQDHPPEPSPVAGLTMAEYRARIHEFLTPEQFGGLLLEDLMEFPLDRLPFPYQVRAFRVCVDLQQWALAEKVLAVIDASPIDREEVDRQRIHLIHNALIKRDVATVTRQFPRIRDPGQLNTILLRTIHLMVPTQHTIKMIEDLAVRGLSEPDESMLHTLTGLVQEFFPALGIALARAALLRAGPTHAEQLLTSIELGRDRLNLPPGDCSRPLFDIRQHLQQVQLMQKAAELQLAAERMLVTVKEVEIEERIKFNDRRAGELAAELARGLHDTAVAEADGSAAEPIDAAGYRRLMRKVEHMKNLIAQGRRERDGLRQEVAAIQAALAGLSVPGPPAPAAPCGAAATGEAEDEEEEEAPGEGAEVRRHVLPPVLTRAAQEALIGLPAGVAREALLAVARLGGGDAEAWGDSKRLKETTLWSVRVARCYRVLFRPADHCLEVLDVIHRRDLPLSKGRPR